MFSSSYPDCPNININENYLGAFCWRIVGGKIMYEGHRVIPCRITQKMDDPFRNLVFK